MFQGGYKTNKRHGTFKYTMFNGETEQLTWVDGVCPEFNARQSQARANVKAAADASAAANYTYSDQQGKMDPSVDGNMIPQPLLAAKPAAQGYGPLSFLQS